MSAIADYRTDIRLSLDDPSTERYTDNAIDQALEIALREYSVHKPLIRTYVLDSTNSKRITMPADFLALAIEDVEWVSDLADFSDGIAYYATLQDEQWILETPGNTIPLGETINVIYHALHTIDGLNSAAGTTIPESDEELVEHGAAGYAARARSTQLVETNNLNPQEAKDLAAIAKQKIDHFLFHLGAVQTNFAQASWHDKTIDKNY